MVFVIFHQPLLGLASSGDHSYLQQEQLWDTEDSKENYRNQLLNQSIAKPPILYEKEVTDFNNGTTADFKVGQNQRFCKRE